MPMRVPLLLLTVVLALAGCSTVSLDQPAPVVSRNTVLAPVVTVVPSGQFAAYAGQSGYYMVQRGDTLSRIAQKSGRKTAQLLEWNQLDNPNVIEVGLVLRVNPPPQAASPVAVAEPLPERAPASSKPAHAPSKTASVPKVAKASAPHQPVAKPPHKPASQPATPSASAAVAGAPSAVGAGPGWLRPVKGAVLQGFNGSTSQGVDFAGKLGDPVLAAASGKVVYAGSELRGFGNLVIIKHDNDYLSVYGHNDKLLVKDGQQISQGQQIATMGSSDASRVELHFEVRLRGKPIDPQQVLPH